MNPMTSMQRVLTTVSHQEPDRVPYFLLLTMHGARELGLSIRDYFSRPEQVAEGQLRMWKRYGHDCLMGFYYAAMELEAWGGETIFYDDGPPNAGAPIIRSLKDIDCLKQPSVKDSPGLQKVLRTISILKKEVSDTVPIIGVVMSPFSLPVIQMGFEGYLELLQNEPAAFAKLMMVNEAFCVEWANAQLAAGATIICYFDPVSSPTIIPRPTYLQTGYLVAGRVLKRINGPIAIHLASGRSLSIIADVVNSGSAAIGVSTMEDLADLKAAARGRLTIVGNLNGIEMRHWTPAEAEAKVKEAIAKAGPDGGFILSDNHGEIPWQVPETVLEAIAAAVKKWGNYPLDWVAGQ